MMPKIYIKKIDFQSADRTKVQEMTNSVLKICRVSPNCPAAKSFITFEVQVFIGVYLENL